MKINVTIELTRGEVLAAITAAVLKEHEYDYKHPLHSGCVLHLEESKDGYFVEWGENPKPVAQVPAVEAVDAPTELEQIEMAKEHRVAMAAAL